MKKNRWVSEVPIRWVRVTSLFEMCSVFGMLLDFIRKFVFKLDMKRVFKAPHHEVAEGASPWCRV